MNICPWGPNAPTYRAYYHCECVDDKYLSPYQTRDHRLSWLPRKGRACRFEFRPLGSITFIFLGSSLPKGTSRAYGAMGISVLSMDPVAIAVLLLEVTEGRAFRRKRRRRRRRLYTISNTITIKSMPGYTQAYIV